MLDNCSGLTLFSDRSLGSLPREQLCVICFLPGPGLGRVAAVSPGILGSCLGRVPGFLAAEQIW